MVDWEKCHTGAQDDLGCWVKVRLDEVREAAQREERLAAKVCSAKFGGLDLGNPYLKEWRR